MTSIEVDRLIAPGFHMKLRRDSCGFNSMLFQKQVDDIKYYAYCTEGTDMTSVKDWFSNVTQGLVGLSPQRQFTVTASVGRADLRPKELAFRELG